MIKCFEQQRVSAARIMVVGCGALGNEVLKNLVLLGVEHLVVVDFDIVEMITNHNHEDIVEHIDTYICKATMQI